MTIYKNNVKIKSQQGNKQKNNLKGVFIMKKLVNLEELNEEEKRTKKISYARLIKRICDNMILCNDITNIDDSLYDNIIIGSVFDEEYDDFVEIYQFFIIDIDEYTIEKLQNLNCTDLIITYSEKLQNYILLVDHFGTSWDYVMTDIEYTENYSEADI